MRVLVSCILILSGLECMFSSFTNPTADWICDGENCGRSNETDQSEGCKWCQEREDENDRLRHEYYREILDSEDPDGSPHTLAEAEEYERSIQQR